MSSISMPQGSSLPPMRPSRGISRRTIVILVAVLAVAMLLGAAVLGGGAYYLWTRNAFAPTDADGYYRAEAVDNAGHALTGGEDEDHLLPGSGTRVTWPVNGGGSVTAHVYQVAQDADALVADSDPDAPPPAEGMVYVQVSLELTYDGSGTYNQWEDMNILVLGGSATYQVTDAYGWVGGTPCEEKIGPKAPCLEPAVFLLPKGEVAEAVLVISPADGADVYLHLT